VSQLPGQSSSEQSEQYLVRLEKMKRLRERGENPFSNGVTPSHLAQALVESYAQKTKEELEPLKIEVSIAGRVMAIRDFGKAGFLQIRDRSGRTQFYAAKDSLGEAGHLRYKELDVGDIVWGKGFVFKTKTGELAVHLNELKLLTKALRPLPEKFHGIADVEIKYRQRYLDLITSPETAETFKKRFRIINEIRSFFLERDYLEVETPMMHAIAGGAAARPFVTHHNTLDMELYLRIAPELYLKRLVVGGLERVFEINRNFRNEGVSIKHNPEFTMLEFYQTYATFEDLMDLTEELFQRLGDRVIGKRQLTYQGTEIELDGKWKRISVEASILELSQFKDAAKIRDRSALMEYGKSKGYRMDPKSSTGALQMVIFDEEVESQLIQPTFITHYPADVSPLSRRNEQDPFLVDRFELFIYGREMGNAFSELNDPLDQRERFLSQVQEKNAGNAEATDHDEDYCVALEHAMPPTAGQGIGIDRLVMLYTDSASIRDVILFPQMRHQASGVDASPSSSSTSP
jgi:lysyl-tRNA synthetase class 2